MQNSSATGNCIIQTRLNKYSHSSPGRGTWEHGRPHYWTILLTIIDTVKYLDCVWPCEQMMSSWICFLRTVVYITFEKVEVQINIVNINDACFGSTLSTWTYWSSGFRGWVSVKVWEQELRHLLHLSERLWTSCPFYFFSPFSFFFSWELRHPK